MTKVAIQPAVALKEAQAEIAFLRNRNLILAQAVQELQDKLLVRPQAAPETPADPADENPA